MISNPFTYRAADARSGSMVEERNFVNLFGVSALSLMKEKTEYIWNLPLLLISAPGGGKSSLMRIFSPSALRYVCETARVGGNRQSLLEQLTSLGAIKDGRPNVLGIWLRLSNEYRSFDELDDKNSLGLFCAMLNSRIMLSALNGICELESIATSDIERISLFLNPGADSIAAKIWEQLGISRTTDLYKKMSDLEAGLCELTDNPFGEQDTASLSHSRLWSLNLLASLQIKVDGKEIALQPLVMLDDIHELSAHQIQLLLKLLMSRQVAVPFWVSLRKQALGLTELLTGNIESGVERSRDYQVIDFENSRGDFRKRVLEISKLRVQSVPAQIGGSSQAFVDFLSDEREEILLNNLDSGVAKDLKNRILTAAGSELSRFETLIAQIEDEYPEPHDRCRHLRMLEILVHREVGKPQKSFGFLEVSGDDFKRHESNKAIVDAAELFLASESNLPYYFGAQRLIMLSSFNINQFLRLAGALFEEIITAIRLERDKDSFISPQRQEIILNKVARDFVKEIPTMVGNGSHVSRLIQAIGDMCRNETYRQTAPYAPGVTGTALTMYDFELLRKESDKGKEPYSELYQTIQSAIAYNILEAEPNYKCKGQEFLVLYLNRLICMPFQLPLQKGGFREQKLDTIVNWMEKGYRRTSSNLEQSALW